MLNARRCLTGEVTLKRWLDAATDCGPGTSNQPALSMPFQRWFKFKEAFAPPFVVDTIKRLPHKPASCLDPFGGSGTTALTCQFLDIEPHTVEVNPFMADVIEAKLCQYDIPETRYAFRSVLRQARLSWGEIGSKACFPGAPVTFVEPGVKGRWLFNIDVAKSIAAIRTEIDKLPLESHRRLLRVLLGSRLVALSNVIVNGKGRRYRRTWRGRPVSSEDVFSAFHDASVAALIDLEGFQNRPTHSYQVLRGDARQLVRTSSKVDFILTSPPYPNSFDYTDIYNLELWVLGYLRSPAMNTALRGQTLRSHVQIAHSAETALLDSPTLAQTYEALSKERNTLWSKRIPEMICHYFADIEQVLTDCRTVLREGGHAVWAVGDSRYSGVHIDVPAILIELARGVGFHHVKTESVRSMRSSAQQGGRHVLKESLVWFSS